MVCSFVLFFTFSDDGLTICEMFKAVDVFFVVFLTYPCFSRGDFSLLTSLLLIDVV